MLNQYFNDTLAFFCLQIGNVIFKFFLSNKDELLHLTDPGIAL